MPKILMVVLTNCLEGREAEFNEWYSETHLDDLLATEGFVSARRYKLSDMKREQLSSHRYLAIYEIEAPDADAAKYALNSAIRSGQIGRNDSIDMPGAVSWYYDFLDERP